MKRFILSVMALATALGLTSCFQSETVIHLKKDGSGTVVEETFLGEQMKAMMAQMSALGGEGADQKDPLAEMFSEDKAKAKVASMGEGVTFDKVEKIKVNAKDGYRVTYKFADINKLKLNPGDAADSMKPEGEGQEEDKKKGDPITFAYADSKLTIKMPKPEPKPKAEGEKAEGGEEEAGDPQQEMMMKQMFADMKISVKLVADDGIAETNATHAKDNAITLMEMDFGKLVQNPEAFKKLQKLNPETPEEFEAAFKGVDGIKVETKTEVTAKLK